MQPDEKHPAQHRSSVAKRLLYSLGALLALYLLTAYVLIPLAWKRDVRRHPDLFEAERITHTPAGQLGDPVNLALLGSESDATPITDARPVADVSVIEQKPFAAPAPAPAPAANAASTAPLPSSH